ncbi:RhoGAP-domain-containing protein [Yamadazyma tenuis ATCC 10573]|uniref:RhoGAP-domain-containing protein n=1 Tax=Candida tenuis (strain ATCC 10573 / BCRC 21748 / CBS 615 / JCM 9827 / NBRC 10315 / NRRL Y-1498 / VKM Y-70) TaxID=590646 RepID=G3AXX7_CANTC|nr:RhoGAP-domain-containing protein [Yamadazyma tenuis ATCC 10573]EGV65717.1 RhoGAP-domain-containing protein [Yamadazyma tenuis ATCC 10573]
MNSNNLQQKRSNRHSTPPPSSHHSSPNGIYPEGSDYLNNNNSYPFHQTNTFVARTPNELPPFLKSQITNQPKVRSSNSIKRDLAGVVGPPPSVVGPPQIRPGSNNNSNEGVNDSNINQLSLGTPFQLKQKKSLRRKRKQCKKCGLDITGQFVRALNSSFHVDCFCCNECGKLCSSKFFPYEMTDKSTGLKYQVALCEYDYFKKLDLICLNCDSALRGPYITALGNKYHLEHFKCNVCQKVFESDESYYEHGSNIYCHYHYSKTFANHCEGCNSSIVKQFVELFRGGRTQQWHPECYMVNKFWNVVIKQDCVGFNPTPSDAVGDKSLDEKDLTMAEQLIENLVIKCWVTLSNFEEMTASSISDMLLNACIGNQFNGLISTGSLIVFIEILFHSIDDLIVLNQRSDPIDIDLKKEPRNLSGKIMSYLAILRKSNLVNLQGSGSLSSELLSVITGCAHYLKLLIRIGLQTSLKLNQARSDSVAIDQFLLTIKGYEKYRITNEETQSSPPRLTETYVKLIQSQLSIPNNSTDLCFHCKTSIEKACIRYKDIRWHNKCFKCSNCSKSLDDINQVNLHPSSNELSCLDCAGADVTNGFVSVSDLSQLIYLLKIAFLRSKQVMALDYKNKKVITKSKEASNDIKSNYSDTLNDITRMRTKRQSHNLSNSIKKNARKSVIIDAPEAENAEATEDTTYLGTTLEGQGVNRNDSTHSSKNSFILSQDDDELFVQKRGEEPIPNNKKMVIRDEPARTISSNHLNRTSDLLRNEKSLTLDDIPRIVAAEQARDQRPNAFKHHNSLYQRQSRMEKIRPVGNITTSMSEQYHENNRNVSSATNKTESGNTEIRQRYYSELDKSEHFIVRHIAIEALSQLTNNKYNKIELLSLIQTKKSTNFWDKFKFHSSNSSDKVHGVFGVDLQDLTKKYGIDSDLGVGPSKLRIPIVIDDIISSLKTKDVSVEGIFRLNGNIKKLKDLTNQINESPLKSPDFTNQTAVQLAALMKKWLRELPNPLLTFNLYDLWIETQKQPDPKLKKRLVKLIYCMLPRSHRNLVEVLLYFFNWVSSFAELDDESGSKMDIHNLATVISPNILYSKNGSEQASDSYFLAIEVVNQLIEMHEELSYLPSDLLEFSEICKFSKTEIQSTKEIMNKIEKVSKEHPNYFISFDIKDELNDPLSSEVRSNTITRGLSKVAGEHHGETGSV